MISKQIIIFSVQDLPSDSHKSLDRELQLMDLDSRGINLTGSIPNKKSAVEKYLIENPDVQDNHGERVVVRIVNRYIKRLLNAEWPYSQGFDYEKKEFPEAKDFYRYLRFDGYDIDFNEGCLKMADEEYLDTSKKEDEILDFLNEYGFITTKGHYNQAKGSYMGNNFAALNGQLRTFVESLFQEMGSYIKVCEFDNDSLKAFNCIDAQSGMQILAKCVHPILKSYLNEWGEENTGYFPAFWRRLHPEGSHPGLPDLDETLYRFQLVVLNVHLIIKRFKLNYPRSRRY